MKRVLFVISTLKNGGAEKALSDLVMNMPKEWDVDILINNDKDIGYPYRGNLISLDMVIPKDNKQLFYHIKLLILRIVKLKELKKKNGYSAVVSFADSANFSNVLSGKKHCKVIVSLHCSLTSNNFGWKYKYIVKPIAKLLYNFSDIIVPVSKEMGEDLISELGMDATKVVPIENGCDIRQLRQKGELEPPRDFLKKIQNRKVIINMGRMNVAKGQWHLIRVFAKMVKEDSNLRLVILGAGELLHYLQQEIEYYNIREFVILTNFVSNPYMYLKYADVFVLPSITEGYPMALIEAICMGLPIVSTDFHSGAREILDPEKKIDEKEIDGIIEADYGFLIPVCSGRMYGSDELLEEPEKIMVKAIRKMLDDEKLCNHYRQVTAERKEKLTIEGMVGKWVSLLE